MQESTGQQYDNKTGQWFGSLVTSSGDDGVVLVGHKDLTKLFYVGMIVVHSLMVGGIFLSKV